MLSAVWPDGDVIYGLNVLTGAAANIHHGVICQPYDKLFASCDKHGLVQVRQMEKPTDSEQAHPVTLARRLLLLSKFLQGAAGEVRDYRGSLGETAKARQALMEDAFAAATRLVTSDDTLVAGSLDGIECIMIESMYLNNAGHLRRAWLANRRVILMAHMLGLHEPGPPKELPVLHNDTRDRIDPAIMWFRLVATDWYLSMILGLPAEITGLDQQPSWVDPEVMARFSPLEQLERTMTAVAGRILLRQHKTYDKTTLHQELYEDDKTLKAATRLLPPKWWLSPNLEADSKHCGVKLQQTLIMMNQFAYYQILMRLHLPHMLSASDGSDFDFCGASRTTAAHAARTILELFEVFRTCQGASTTYCRGVDFVVFTACATLCVAHIETRRRQQLARSLGRLWEVDTLEHQRHLDRAQLDQTVQGSPFVHTEGSDDVIAQKMATVLEPLLRVEEQVAQDVGWAVRIINGQGEADKAETRVSVVGVGTFVLERDAHPQTQLEMPSIDDWPLELEGVDSALFSSMMEGLF